MQFSGMDEITPYQFALKRAARQAGMRGRGGNAQPMTKAQKIQVKAKKREARRIRKIRGKK